jgi:hypothetical protein
MGLINLMGPSVQADMGMPTDLYPRQKAPIVTGKPVYQAPEKKGFFEKLGSGAMEYLGDPTNRARLAAAFNTMRLNPDPNIARMAQSQIETQQALDLLKGQGTRTAEWLKSVGREDLAQLVLQQPAMAKTAVAEALKAPDTPSAIREYEYAKTNFGFKGTYEDFLRAKNPVEGGDIIAGEYAKQLPKSFEGYEDRGSTANRQNTALSSLGRMLAGTETGGTAETKAMLRGFASRLGLPYDEAKLADAQAVQAFSRQIVAEELRQNKGPQTDFDARFAETYLPGIGQEPQANEKILQYMKSRNLIDAVLGRLASQRPYEYEKDIEVKRFLDSARTTIGATVEQNGQFVTFEEFYNKARSGGVSDRQIIEGWMGLH